MTSDVTTVSTAVPATTMTSRCGDSNDDSTHAKPANMALSDTIEREQSKEKASLSTPKSFGFYAIILALCLTGLLTSLEATITSTALPTITAVLGGGDLFIWVINGYYLTMTAFQPLFGQIANIYGRRWPVIFATALFTLGSGLCGGASNIEMLIAGRLVQGVGAGAINVLIEIVVCDLLPLRERGKYLGMMFGMIGLGTTLGPLFGGLIVQHASWRWVFYLNLPIGGLALVALVVFLKVKSDHTLDFSARLKQIDWFGNIIFVLSTVAVLIALSWAGTRYQWTSFRVILPLVLSFAGYVLFMFFEASRFCLNPTMPIHLFSNRTSGTAFVLTFLHVISGISAIYFLPVYFQGVLAATPSRAGIQLLPTILGIIPGAIAAGTLLSKFGRYRPLQHVGFALMVVGFGLLSLLKLDSSTGAWVGFQLVGAVGTGLVLPVLLPSVQASLNEADTALSTSTWSFIRSFGLIWGATIPTASFNNRFNSLAYRITDPRIAAELSGGRAYEHATKAYMETITDPVTHAQVIDVFIESLKLVWYVSIAFAGFGFLLVILEKEVPLRKELDTEFGIDVKDKRDKSTTTSEEMALPTEK